LLEAVAMSHAVTVPELLDGHTVLDIKCLDRVCLNGYVPVLQTGGQVFTFLHGHRRMPIASPAVFSQISGRFGQAVNRFAEMNDIPVVTFSKGVRKLDVMQRYLLAAARAGRPGVAAIGRAEEFQLVWDARKRDTGPSRPPQFFFVKAERRVTCYYFYVVDEQRGGRVHQDLRVLPLSGEDLGQRPRAGQAAADPGRGGVHRAVQRVRPGRRPGRAAGRLRPARACRHPGVLRPVDGPDPGAADRR
jgi:hypothetical protein